MAGYILHKEGDLKLRRSDVDRVLKSGDGDAALLYLALMNASGGLEPDALAKELQMSSRRLAAAEKTLQELGVVSGDAAILPPAPERPEFTAGEMAAILEEKEYAAMRRQVEEQLGRKLTLSDDRTLAGLYHDRGLPTDVLYQLVKYCIHVKERCHGRGSRPTLKDIEKEGYHWVNLGIFDQAAATDYIWKRDQQMGYAYYYMKALQLGDRPPVESELKYLMDWMEMGFPPETVAKAYDITVLRKQKMDWRYLGGVLRRWHEKGWHTPEEVEQGEQAKQGEQAQRAPARKNGGGAAGGNTAATDSGNSWVRKYMED